MKNLCAMVVSATLVVGMAPATPALAAAKAKRWVDPCAATSKELQHAKGSVGRLIFGRAALGSLIGVGGRLLFDKDASNEDLIKSAVAGGVVGAASGYWESKRRQNSDVQALAGSVYQDVAKSNAEAAKALRAFTEVRACRLQAAGEIKAAYERGDIDEPTARKRLKDLKEKLEKDVAAAEQFAEDYDKALDSFRVAAGHLAEGKPEDQAYVRQFGPGLSAQKTKLVSAKSNVNVRQANSTTAGVVGKLVAGDTAEFISSPDAAWTQVRLKDGATGFVATRYLSMPGDGAPAVRRVNMAKVSAEVKTVGQPLFEGVEKRSALDSEIKLAKANVSSSTFEL